MSGVYFYSRSIIIFIMMMMRLLEVVMAAKSVELFFSFHFCVVQGLNSGHRLTWQPPLPTKPSYHFGVLLFYFILV